MEGAFIIKPHRSPLKAVSCRIPGGWDTSFISFPGTEKLKAAVLIGLIELSTKILLYYLHERIWNRISSGRVKARDEDSI